MSTEAGKRLLVASEQATNLRHIRPVFADEVRAIEVEAVAAERERIAEAIQGLPHYVGHPGAVVGLAAVLAIVNPERPPSCEQHPEDY